MDLDEETTFLLCFLSQPVAEAATEELVSEEVGQSRQKFLSSLLKAIEETNGGTLLHLLGQQEKECSSQQMPSNIGESVYRY